MKKLFKKKPDNCEFVPAARNYIARCKKTKATKSHYRSAIKHVEKYQDSRAMVLMSDSFTHEICEDFISYLKDRNLMLATQKAIFKRITYLLNALSNSGYKVNFSCKDIDIQLDEVNAVYLTSDEIERLRRMQVRGKEQELARDLFLLGCLTGMRYSDYTQLTSKNIQGNCIVRRTQKTSETVYVPMHSIVREILEKYNGEFPRYRNSHSNFNKIIKRICKRAGITDNVLYERTHGHQVVRKTMKKYELIGSHTARRSFATNAYLAGIQPAKIMLMTGHKTETSFFSYIRINKKENARQLAEHPFFQ